MEISVSPFTPCACVSVSMSISMSISESETPLCVVSDETCVSKERVDLHISSFTLAMNINVGVRDIASGQEERVSNIGLGPGSDKRR